MPRKVMLSFLGNNQYLPCCYTYQNFTSGVVRFVQEAILELTCQDWQKNDQVYIFLTPEASRNNWEGAFYGGQGLKAVMRKFDHLSIKAIQPIPTGLSESEIWALFELIFEQLQPADEVYLDITNGFRSLPMLLMGLLDYAKTLKNIRVKKIYYGAFEALGTYSKIKEHYPHPTERLAPILDLTSLSALQDWTAAAADFKLYGKIARLHEIINHSLEPMLKTAKGKDETINLLRKINKNIQNLVPLIQTNRGKALGLFYFNQLNDALTQFSKSAHLIKPLKAVIKEMEAKVQSFHQNDPLFWLKTAKWCRDHGLIQQGITQLQEGIITWLCVKFKKELATDFFDYTKTAPRNLINGVFTILEKSIPRNKWQRQNKNHVKLTRAVMEDALIQKTATLFRNIGALRNDINHGGYIYNAKPTTFFRKLSEYIEAVEVITQNKTKIIPLPKKQKGLLNLSYAPFTEWKPKQQAQAKQVYGTVADMLFPSILPTLSKDAFTDLVNQYYQDIMVSTWKAVYIMGEMTFTFALVQRLKAAGVICIASAGERQVEDGLLVSFEFVGFRDYL